VLGQGSSFGGKMDDPKPTRIIEAINIRSTHSLTFL